MTPPNGQLRLDQFAVEVDRLVDRLSLRAADDEEAGAGVGEQLVDPLGARLEAVDHAAEGVEELGQVGQQVEADDPFEDAQRDRGAAAGDLRRQPGRLHEHAQRFAFDELGQPFRRIEEVERVAGRRGVEDEQVEVAFGVQLEQLLHRHVLLGAGEGAGDLLVDPVFEDPFARLLVGRLAGDQLVEGLLRVEHHRPQLALDLDPLLLEQLRVDAPAPRCRAPSARASRRAASPGRSSARRPSVPAPPSRSRSPPRWSSCRPRRSRRRCRSACPRGPRPGLASAQFPRQLARSPRPRGRARRGRAAISPAPRPGGAGAIAERAGSGRGRARRGPPAPPPARRRSPPRPASPASPPRLWRSAPGRGR